LIKWLVLGIEQGLRAIMNPSHELLMFAMHITQAECGLMVDEALQVVGTHAEGDFSFTPDDVMLANLRHAIETQESLIGNNFTTDAPDTNTNVMDLRVAVVLPVSGTGAIYLDKPVRQGVITKSVIDRLMHVIQQMAKNPSQSIDQDTLHQLYTQAES
jgi:hypothetical protein